MNICEHIITKTEIIGIGPLMVHQSNDQALRMLYNSRQLFFLLHLKNHSVKIESNWFDLAQSETAKADYKKFCSDYEEAKNIVLELVTREDLINA